MAPTPPFHRRVQAPRLALVPAVSAVPCSRSSQQVRCVVSPSIFSSIWTLLTYFQSLDAPCPMLRASPRSFPGRNATLKPSVFHNLLLCCGLRSFPRPVFLTSSHLLSRFISLHLLPRLVLYRLPPRLALRRLVLHRVSYCLSPHLALCHPSLSRSSFPPLRHLSWETDTTSRMPPNNTSSPNLPLINRRSSPRGSGFPPGPSAASPIIFSVTEQCLLNHQH